VNNKHRKASPEIRRRLAVNLKRLRKAKGYTQIELARRSGMRNRYISKIENEQVNTSLANLEALSIALECWEVDLLWPVKEEGHP
jgi:transcriptional regulator with XRE-family HTH domain